MTNQLAHTPVEWEATPYGEHWSFAYDLANNQREEYDFTVEFHETVDEQEQSAVIHLIEAAPELLAACRMVVDRWERGDLAAAARACTHAIAKATAA
jgi:hypothetical protein